MLKKETKGLSSHCPSGERINRQWGHEPMITYTDTPGARLGRAGDPAGGGHACTLHLFPDMIANSWLQFGDCQ